MPLYRTGTGPKKKEVKKGLKRIGPSQRAVLDYITKHAAKEGITATAVGNALYAKVSNCAHIGEATQLRETQWAARIMRALVDAGYLVGRGTDEGCFYSLTTEAKQNPSLQNS